MARKAIFITGGGSGIGRAVARHFAGQGWFVGIADVNRAGIDETASLLPEGASSRHMMDVRDRDHWKAEAAGNGRPPAIIILGRAISSRPRPRCDGGESCKNTN